MRKPKERVIYDSMDMFDDDLWNETKQEIWNQDYEGHELEELSTRDDYEPSDDRVWQWIYADMDDRWTMEYDQLKDFFNGKGRLLCLGTIGRWTGRHSAGRIFGDFESLVSAVLDGCEYSKIWDENGHLYIEGTHHDGTNRMEIKILTERGYEYYDRWSWALHDDRREYEVYEALAKNSRYAHIPCYAERQYGCKRYEYEKEGTR